VITRRDLGTEPLPVTTWRDVVTSSYTAEADRTQAQRDAHALAGALADELIDADALLLAIPLYNWGVAAHVKSWYDVTYTDQRIAGGALKGKPVVLATVLGGNYNPGTPKEGWDHSTPWLRHVISDVWGADLLVVQRQFTLVGVNPALDQFTEQAAEIKAASEQLAIEHGRALAAKR
jgi:FMN-dependent NADH-azoreductase